MVGKPLYYDVIDTAEAFGWVDGLTRREWEMLVLLLQRASHTGWHGPVSMAASSIADRLRISKQQVWRLRKSLERKGPITVKAGHGDMPGRPAQAAWYAIHYNVLREPYGETNSTPAYEAAKAAAARNGSAQATGNTAGHVAGRVTGRDGLTTYVPNRPSSSPSARERPAVSADAAERKKEQIESKSQTPERPAAEGARDVDDTRRLVDHITALDGVVLPPRELSAPPRAFGDAVRGCRDAGMTQAAMGEVAKEAAKDRSNPTVRTLRYFVAWLERAAGDAATSAQVKEDERSRRRKLTAEQAARNAAHERAVAEAVPPPEDAEVLRRLAPGMFASQDPTKPDTPFTDGAVDEGVQFDGVGPRPTALSSSDIKRMLALGVGVPASAVASLEQEKQHG